MSFMCVWLCVCGCACVCVCKGVCALHAGVCVCVGKMIGVVHLEICQGFPEEKSAGWEVIKVPLRRASVGC